MMALRTRDGSRRLLWLPLAMIGLGAAGAAVALWMEPGDYPFAMKVVAGVWVVVLLLYVIVIVESRQRATSARGVGSHGGAKTGVMGLPHVFISYVRENKEEVDRLADALIRSGVKVWLDRNEIRPGMFWQDAIRKAIGEGEFFVACFSAEYNAKHKTHMNEEIRLAIEELRRRKQDQAWFIPVVLSGEVPDWGIGAGKSLRDLQRVDLDDANWEAGVEKILSAVHS